MNKKDTKQTADTSSETSTTEGVTSEEKSSSKLNPILIGVIIAALLFGIAIGMVATANTSDDKQDDMKQEKMKEEEKTEEKDDKKEAKVEEKIVEVEKCDDRTYVDQSGGFKMSFKTVCDQNVYVSQDFEQGTTVYVNDEHVLFIKATDASPGYLTISIPATDAEYYDYMKGEYSAGGDVFTNNNGIKMYKVTADGMLGKYTSYTGKITLSGTDYYFQISIEGDKPTAAAQKVIDTFDLE